MPHRRQQVIADSAGTIKSESDYYSWGGELQFVNNDGNHYKFTRKERDAESGLDYFGARYYGNWLGRYLTPDWAAKPTAVPYANFGDPQSLNLYTYDKNNPGTFGDSDGHCPQCIAYTWLWDKVKEGAKSFGIGVVKEIHNAAAERAAHNPLAFGESTGSTSMGTGMGATPIIQTPSNKMEVAGMVTAKVAPLLIPVVGELRAGAAIVELTNISTASVIHFTSDVGVEGITASEGILRTGTYVTTPGEIPAGSTSSQIESLLEIGPGKGTNSVTLETPNSNLAVPENGPTTSGGAQQFQLKEPTKVDPSTFKKTDPQQ